jgi:hypothetical protein
MAARIIGGILAILGALVAIGGGALMLDDANSAREVSPELRELGEMAGTDMNMGELEDIIALQERTAYALFGAAALGVVGAILAFLGMGTVAGVLLLIGGVAPFAVRPEPVIFLFTGLLIIAALVSFFARKKPKAPLQPAAPTEPQAPAV